MGRLSNMTTRCFGVAETFKGITQTPQGYCVYRDADGDQIVYKTGNEKHDEEKSVLEGLGPSDLGHGEI